MKNPFKNIFNKIKNKLQKSKKNKDETPKTDELINPNHLQDEIFEKNEINQKEEFAIKQEENKIKKPMSDEEVKKRAINLLKHLDNDLNYYKNSSVFLSITGIKNFTEAMIDKYFRYDYSDIQKEYIDFAEYLIVKQLLKQPDFELPDLDRQKLKKYFNTATQIIILEKKILERDYKKMENLVKESSKTEQSLNKNDIFNQQDFENTEEGSGANTPKASIIPKFIQSTPIVGLSQY